MEFRRSLFSRWRHRNPAPVIAKPKKEPTTRVAPIAAPQPRARTTAAAHPSSAKFLNAKAILVMNSKGGAGKTTLSTNLAAQLAARSAQNKVVLVDHDPQGSCARWLRARSPRHKGIDGIFPARDNLVKFKRTWRLLVDKEATHVIIDTPAGLVNFDLTDRIREADLIVIPVMPSAIDIAATSDFVSKVFVNPAYINANKKMAVVANRVNKDMHNFAKLERFLFSLGVPFISVFNDHNRYLLASERGCGINEMPATRQPFHDLLEWEKLLEWVDAN